MDIADCSGVPLRRWLRDAERFSDSAISCGLLDLKTSFSRSSALLPCVTAADHFRGRDALALIAAKSQLMAFEKLHLALMALGGFQRRKHSQIAPRACVGIALARVKPVVAGFQFANHNVFQRDLRVRSALRPVAANPARPFVRTALCAAADLSPLVRCRAAKRVCPEMARGEAEPCPSRLKAPIEIRERRRETPLSPRRPFS